MQRTQLGPRQLNGRGDAGWSPAACQVQVASLLCSPDSPSSPAGALQDRPQAVASQELFQVVPIGSEDCDGPPPLAGLEGWGCQAAVPPPSPPRPLPAVVPAPGPVRALPSGTSHRRVPARVAKRKSALPAVPRLAPLPDGDLIESFSDNPLLGTPQEREDQKGTGKEVPQAGEESNPILQRSERAGVGSEPSPASAGKLPQQEPCSRSSGVKELPACPGPAANPPQRALRCTSSRFPGKHIIDVTDFDGNCHEPLKRRRLDLEQAEVAPGSQSCFTKTRKAASCSASQRMPKSLQRRAARRLLTSQRRLSQCLSQRMSQHLSQRLSQRRRAPHGTSRTGNGPVRRGGWILSKDDPRSDQRPLRDAETSRPALEGPEITAPSEHPDVLFTGFARSDLHVLRGSVNCLGGLAVNFLRAGAGSRGKTNVRLVVQCSIQARGEDRLPVATKRSIKYMEGVLAGAWILSPEWVHASMRAGHWLPEVRLKPMA